MTFLNAQADRFTLRTDRAWRKYAHKLEYADADSSGSTLRAMGVVTLVLIIVAVVGVAVFAQADSTAVVIANARYSFGP